MKLISIALKMIITMILSIFKAHMTVHITNRIMLMSFLKLLSVENLLQLLVKAMLTLMPGSKVRKAAFQYYKIKLTLSIFPKIISDRTNAISAASL